eukprot:snap_masked-scaffold_37-processed-gene-0.20-mRNA-1 protein AED:1.00 eAED:1.00 QI:0/0/0/0/1/1/2/0/271
MKNFILQFISLSPTIIITTRKVSTTISTELSYQALSFAQSNFINSTSKSKILNIEISKFKQYLLNENISFDKIINIKDIIQYFINTRFSSEYTIIELNSMNEIYATNFGSSEDNSVGDLTVENIHCDGNIPNIFGCQTFRLLICLYSNSKTTETCFLSIDSDKISEEKVKLKNIGEYLIFDYNCQPHYVKSGGEKGIKQRVFIKIHFLVKKKKSWSSAYEKLVQWENRYVRKKQGKAGVIYIINNYLKTCLFDNSLKRNFGINLPTVDIKF